jgi:hypothetical protein
MVNEVERLTDSSTKGRCQADVLTRRSGPRSIGGRRRCGVRRPAAVSSAAVCGAAVALWVVGEPEGRPHGEEERRGAGRWPGGAARHALHSAMPCSSLMQDVNLQ